MSSRADFQFDGEFPQHYGLESALTYIWDVPTLSWVKNSGGGGGGGDASAANQVIGNASLASIDGKVSLASLQLPDGHNVTVDNAAGGAAVNIQDGGNTITVDGSVTANPSKPATGTRTQVADTASDTLLLASNASRFGAQVFNDSSALLYLGLGTTTVTATNYTAKVFGNGYYEAPSDFTGQIRGIWATDPGDGGAKVTELTA